MIMILCCFKNVENILFLKSCWLNKCPIPYVFILGDEKLDTEYKYNSTNNILTVKCGDDYDSLVYKVKAGIVSIMKEFNPDYIIKCDDDMFVNNDTLQEYVNLMMSFKVHYHGRETKYTKGRVDYFGIKNYNKKINKLPFLFTTNISYATGGLYFISKEACQVLIETMDPEISKFEDVAVGLTLQSKNILLNTEQKYKKFVFTYNIRHYLNGDNMCWTDDNHITLNKDYTPPHIIEDGPDEPHMKGSEKWTVPYLMGGLGNQMFTISAAYITSVANNLPLNIFKFTNNSYSNIDYFKTIYRNFPGIKTEPFKDNVNYKLIRQQNSNGVKENQVFQCWNPYTNANRCILFGNFQYYRNIIPYEKEIRSLFLSGLSEQRDSLLIKYNFDNVGFIHVRRGDYLKSPNTYYLQPVQYYEKALEKHDSSLKFFVVSDDNQWIKSEKFLKNDRFTIFEGDELETLALMSLCTSGAICANSSFSWWGAFLGAYEKRNPVTVPQKWINFPDSENLIPEEWITISL